MFANYPTLFFLFLGRVTLTSIRLGFSPAYLLDQYSYLNTFPTFTSRFFSNIEMSTCFLANYIHFKSKKNLGLDLSMPTLWLREVKTTQVVPYALSPLPSHSLRKATANLVQTTGIGMRSLITPYNSTSSN